MSSMMIVLSRATCMDTLLHSSYTDNFLEIIGIRSRIKNRASGEVAASEEAKSEVSASQKSTPPFIYATSFFHFSDMSEFAVCYLCQPELWPPTWRSVNSINSFFFHSSFLFNATYLRTWAIVFGPNHSPTCLPSDIPIEARKRVATRFSPKMPATIFSPSTPTTKYDLQCHV